jgi:hypothetical protein
MEAAGSSEMFERIFQTTGIRKMEVVGSSEILVDIYQITRV